VKNGGTVDAHSNLESVCLKELAPVLGEQDSVGLQGIRDNVVVLPQEILYGDRFLVEGAAAGQRFAAMPDELNARVSQESFLG
jgi:hypothetical protein